MSFSLASALTSDGTKGRMKGLPIVFLAFCGCILASYWTLITWQTPWTLDLSSVLDFAWQPRSYVCSDPKYQVRILSYDPFVAHLEDFISAEERSHLKALANPLLFKSKVRLPEGGVSLHKGRDSFTAHLPKSDPVVQCLTQRASVFQGYVNPKGIDLQATYYEQGGFYRPHLDAGWGTPDGFSANGISFRVSTIFGIVDSNCQDCGTEFPNLFVNTSMFNPEWCKFVECGSDVSTLITKAVKGSAVFWRNRYNDGSVDDRLLHAGLPIPNGTKFGLNIWTSTKGPRLVWDND